jgi:hypothetical protein
LPSYKVAEAVYDATMVLKEVPFALVQVELEGVDTQFLSR